MANGQTVLTYGDEFGERLMLFRCQTPRIRQLPVMDQTGTDLKCWRHEITVVGYIQSKVYFNAGRAFQFHQVFDGNGPYGTEITVTDGGGGNPPAGAARAQRQARWRLPPRQRFILRTGVTDTALTNMTLPGSGVKLYDVQAAATVFSVNPNSIADRVTTGAAYLQGIDVNDGPVCHECTIEHVTADNIFKVRVTFVVHLVECADDGGTPGKRNGVLSNRWSCTDQFDVNMRATRVYEGMLEIISARFSPHWFRSLVLPPLQPGFRRESMVLTASADGKKLQWQVVDQSVHVAAPYPARKWAIVHTEGSLTQDGLKSMGSINITLEGDTDADRGDLIMLGLHVISAKLLLVPLGVAPQANALVGDVSITEFIGDVNAVQLSASVQRVKSEHITGIGINSDSLAKEIDFNDLPDFANTPQYDPWRSRGARDGDVTEYEGPESLIKIFRCFLQVPCNDIHSTDITTNQLGTDYNATPSPIATTVIGSISSTITTEPSDSYSTEHTTKMYRFYQCESHYTKKTLRAAMPLAINYEGPDNDPKVTTKFVKIGGSQGRREVRLHSERIGDWPQFPDPEEFDGLSCLELASHSMAGTSQDITMSLISSRIVPGTRTLTSTGETIYRATMGMRFALSRCPRPKEVLKIGVDVWGKVGPFTTASSDPALAGQSPLTGDVKATNKSN